MSPPKSPSKPLNAYRMTATFKNFAYKLSSSLSSSSVPTLKNDDGSFGLTVHLEVVIPDLPHDEAQRLADEAHRVCPYSNATRGNIEVTVTVSDD